MKLSIIVPVYNTRDYLADCLASVLIPAREDYEIIVVNDGSTDDSETIAKHFAYKHPEKIRLITTENGGLGAARNVGIQNAGGDYLLFLDSDDTLAPGALTEILDALDGSFDICIFDFSQVNPSGSRVGALSGCGSIKKDFTLSEYPELLFQLPSACNKLIRRTLFCDSGVLFPGRVWFEDLRTIPKLYPLAERIRYIPREWYRYLIRPGSITNSRDTVRNLEIIDAVQEILNCYRQLGLYETYEKELCYLAFYNAFLTSSVRVNAADRDSGVQDALLNWFLSSFPDYRSNPYIQSMPVKYRLLRFLLMHRMRRSVYALMRLNDLARHKQT